MHGNYGYDSYVNVRKVQSGARCDMNDYKAMKRLYHLIPIVAVFNISL